MLIVNFLNLAVAEVSPPSNTIQVFPLVPGLSPHTLEHFVLDVLLPRLIAEDAPLVVHGALMSRGDDGICLVGDSGRGKSTLSAALRAAGWDFHGDDALVLRPDGAGITAQATYPSLRLLPDSLQQLFPEPPAGLSPVADYLDKYRFDPGNMADPTLPCRLRAVFVLGGDVGTAAATALTASRLCMTLIGQAFALDPSDPKGAHARLSAASAVAAAVPGFMLDYPRDYACLPEVIEKIGAILLEAGQNEAAGPADRNE
ncbi:hypothetical protein [Antarctobacter heliothermus]|uniref:hypothetical protein n=1 Tax=Antarctobacter heliothermus TaxID=74033 RepID=UPI000B8C21E5|nr:hypothetical protein [Antarctobacter heliothermus]